MKLFGAFFFLLLSLSIFSCRTQWIVGTTYFAEHGIDRLPVNLLRKEGTFLIKGIYLSHSPLFQRPIIMTLAGKQIAYAVLDSPLPVEAGEYIEVDGEAITEAESRQFLLRAAPHTVRRLASYADLMKQAGRYYRRQRSALADAVDCPLEFPKSPQMLAVLDEERRVFAAFFSSADMLYSAQFDLIFDAANRKLKCVYVDCRFKGE